VGEYSVFYLDILRNEMIGMTHPYQSIF